MYTLGYCNNHSNYREYKGKEKCIINFGPPPKENRYMRTHSWLGIGDSFCLFHFSDELNHCQIMPSTESENKQGEENEGKEETKEETEEVKEKKGKESELREVDLSKDDFFVAIAKLATTKSTGKTKVQSVN